MCSDPPWEMGSGFVATGPLGSETLRAAVKRDIS